MQFPELVYNFQYSIAELDDNISIAYWDSGNTESKNVLLFIHGLSSYIPAWSKLIPLLHYQFRCIAIDLPGYGKSSEGVHSGSIDFYTKVISNLISKLDLKNVSLVGHSMGGQIAAATSITFPNLIDRLILLAPAGFETFSEDEKQWIKRNNSPTIYQLLTDNQIRKNYEINFYEMPDDVEFMIQYRINMKKWKNYKNYCQIVANSLNGLISSPIYDRLSKIKNSTLIVFGLNDKLIPHPVLHSNLKVQKIAEGGAAKIPNSKLTLIYECGHFLQYEKPNQVASEIIHHLEK